MDTQIDYAVGLPIDLLDELPPPVDLTEQAPLSTTGLILPTDSIAQS